MSDGRSRENTDVPTFLHLFEAITRDQRTIFFLDDFHWTDRTSLAVLQFVYRRWRASGLTVVLSYRPEELREHDPASRLVRDLEVDPRLTAVRLGPLDPGTAKQSRQPSRPSRRRTPCSTRSWRWPEATPSS